MKLHTVLPVFLVTFDWEDFMCIKEIMPTLHLFHNILREYCLNTVKNNNDMNITAAAAD